MDTAYIIIFAIGVLYTFVSLIVSGVSGAFHLGSDFGHGGHGGDIGGAHTHAHIGGHGFHSGDAGGHSADTGSHGGGFSDTLVSWLSILINPIAAVSFLTVFGGVGILGTNLFRWTAAIVFAGALAAGIVAATVLYRFIASPLYRSENSTHVSREDLIGSPGEVASAIIENGFGEIRYTVNSIKYTAPARHIEGRAMEQDAKVVICKIENSIFYVSEVQDL